MLNKIGNVDIFVLFMTSRGKHLLFHHSGLIFNSQEFFFFFLSISLIRIRTVLLVSSLLESFHHEYKLMNFLRSSVLTFFLDYHSELLFLVLQTNLHFFNTS